MALFAHPFLVFSLIPIFFLPFLASQNDENDTGSNSDQESDNSIFQRSFKQVIEKLEEVFNQIPNPENHVIEKLSEELGLDTTQVEIWFENKRCYIQVQRDMEENKKLHSEYLKMQSELKKGFCATCNNHDQQKGSIIQELQNENAKLKKEVTMISNIIDRFKEDPEGYLFLVKQDYLHNYNDPNGLDLELKLKSSS